MSMDSERQELFDIFQRAIEAELGSGFTTEDLVESAGDLPAHVHAYVAMEGLHSLARAFCRQRGDDGLPLFPAVNAEGRRVSREAMTPEEYDYAVISCVRRADKNYAQAYKWGAAKLAAYGLPCILDGVDWSHGEVGAA